MPLTPLQTLKKARALISDPKRWQQGHYACTKSGTVVESGSKRAFSHCAEGAVFQVVDGVGEGLFSTPTKAAIRALDGAAKRLSPGDNAVSFNDAPGRSHSDVLRMFDIAIHSLQRKSSKRKTAKKGKAKAKRGKR